MKYVMFGFGFNLKFVSIKLLFFFFVSSFFFISFCVIIGVEVYNFMLKYLLVVVFREIICGCFVKGFVFCYRSYFMFFSFFSLFFVVGLRNS